MKQYAILNHSENSPVIVSTNSHDFADYIHLGYSIVFQGNKKQCMEIMEMEESLC